MRSAPTLRTGLKAMANLKTLNFAQQQGSDKGLETPTRHISNSQREIFHTAEDLSYFQECHFRVV